MIRRCDPLAHPERLIRRVYAYAAYRLGDGQDAEDVTMETFARALRYRDSYDRSKGEPIAWLIGIARRCADAMAASTARAWGDVPDVAGDDGFEERALERITLTDAIARLGARDRELVALRYGADLTVAQVGERLGMTTNAAHVAIHRAVAQLRAHLVQPVDETDDEIAVRVSPPALISVLQRKSGTTGEVA
jgi:RNA polymerase sigma-70 factor, ECF subfamily